MVIQDTRTSKDLKSVAKVGHYYSSIILPTPTNRIIQKKSEYSVYVYGAFDVRLFPNKRLNVDLKNIEIWVSHGLKSNS